MMPLVPAVEVKAPIRDPKDVMVIGAALSGAATGIVTGDADFLEDGDLWQWLTDRHVSVYSVPEFLKKLQ